jgi:Trans-aconitate methyltransferase
MNDWNADLYNRFSQERKQPAIDLVNRIDKSMDIKRIIDIGCGTGMSTIPLKLNWEKAEIIGVDNSDSMLEKARELDQQIKWLKWDCNKPVNDFGKFDLVFSNAALQWFEDQASVIGNLSSILNPNGILAMQIPNFTYMGINLGIQKVADQWTGAEFEGIGSEICVCHGVEFYYEQLTKHFKKIDLWQTTYYHIMNSHEEILEFYKSTGLRPYLNRLDDNGKERFLTALLEETRHQYKIQENNKVLFEFNRIFFLATDQLKKSS